MIELLNHILPLQPYRMVVASSLYLFLYLLIIFIYTKIYPKKKISYIILLIGLSILPNLSNLRSGAHESGDFTIHVSRAYTFYESLKQGIIVPRWHELSNATYGYAVYVYIYPFPYYITSLLHVIGFSFIDTVKLSLGIFYVLSGVAFYLWLNKLYSKKTSFVGAVFYLFAPYHLIDLHFRAHLGEITLFAFMPLTLLAVDNVKTKNNFLWIFLMGLFLSICILSHPGVSLFFIFFVFIYSMLSFKDTKSKSKTFYSDANLKNISLVMQLKKRVNIFIGFVIALGLSSYYLIPFVLEKRITPLITQETVLDFPKLTSLLYAPWRYGLLFQGPQGEYAIFLGYAHILIIVAAFVFYPKFKESSRYKFFLLSTIVLIFFLQKFSLPVWNAFGVLAAIKLPYRILSLIAITSSALVPIIIAKVGSKTIIYSLLLLAVLTTILNWGNRGMISSMRDKQVIAETPFLSLNSTLDKLEIPSKHFQAVDGELSILRESRKINTHFYVVNRTGNGLVRENTYNFYGWKVFVDGEERKIIKGIGDDPNVIHFFLDEGIHNVQLIFTVTPVRFYSRLIRNLTLGICGVYLIYDSRKKKIAKVKN